MQNHQFTRNTFTRIIAVIIATQIIKTMNPLEIFGNFIIK